MNFSAWFKFASACAVLAACGTAPAASDATSADSTLVPGSTLSSPNADPNAVYRPARNIANLQTLGALNSVQASLAGKIDRAPADGSYSLDELIAVESPATLVHLTAEERIALPTLWQLLATATDAPQTVTFPDALRLTADDTSLPGTRLQPPASLSLATLTDALQRVAAHVESVHDADNSPATIAVEDLDAVAAAPAGFQPWELAQIDLIRSVFGVNSTTTLSAVLTVSPPKDATTTKLITIGSASIGVRGGIQYEEHRTWDTRSGNIAGSLRGHVTQAPTLTAAVNTTILVLGEDDASEVFVPAGPFASTAGTRTFEVWQGGQRQGVYRVTANASPIQDESVNLSAYLDYALVDSDGALKKYAVQGSVTTDSGVSTYDVTSHWVFGSGYDVPSPEILAHVATPAFGVPAGQYVFGDVTLELAPQGALIVKPGNGPIEHAIVRGNTFVLPSGAPVALSYDPDGNALSVSDPVSGAVFFEGTLTADLRQN